MQPVSHPETHCVHLCNSPDEPQRPYLEKGVRTTHSAVLPVWVLPPDAWLNVGFFKYKLSDPERFWIKRLEWDGLGGN